MVTSTQGDDVMEVQIFHMPLLPNMMISGMLLHIRWRFKQPMNGCHNCRSAGEPASCPWC